MDTPREMIRTNAPHAIGIQDVVLWVRITSHRNPYIDNPEPVGLLRIHEVGMDGQIINATFSENGVSPFVGMNDPGFRHTAFEVTTRTPSITVPCDKGEVTVSVDGDGVALVAESPSVRLDFGHAADLTAFLVKQLHG